MSLKAKQIVNKLLEDCGECEGDFDVERYMAMVQAHPQLRRYTKEELRRYLAMRPPAQPPGGDAGEEIAVLVDEKTGLSFSARLYKGYGMNQIKLMAFYGIKVWKPEFVATLLG